MHGLTAGVSLDPIWQRREAEKLRLQEKLYSNPVSAGGIHPVVEEEKEQKHNVSSPKAIDL